jgi:hypothetical protein
MTAVASFVDLVIHSMLPIDQPDTECHKSSASEARDPGDIISEPRATSSRNAWAASSESAIRVATRVPRRGGRERWTTWAGDLGAANLYEFFVGDQSQDGAGGQQTLH